MHRPAISIRLLLVAYISASFTATIATGSPTILNVSSFSFGSGNLAVGDIINGPGVASLTTIVTCMTCTGSGGTGTYAVTPSQTISPGETMTTPFTSTTSCPTTCVPVYGSGIQNLTINANGIANYGLQMIGLQEGVSRNVTCENALISCVDLEVVNKQFGQSLNNSIDGLTIDESFLNSGFNTATTGIPTNAGICYTSNDTSSSGGMTPSTFNVLYANNVRNTDVRNIYCTTLDGTGIRMGMANGENFTSGRINNSGGIIHATGTTGISSTTITFTTSTMPRKIAVGMPVSDYASAGGAGVLPTVSFTGFVLGTTMTTSSVSGTLTTNQSVTGTGVSGNTTIISQLSGTAGGAGTYEVSQDQTVGGSGEAMTAVPTIISISPTGTSPTITISNAATASGSDLLTIGIDCTILDNCYAAEFQDTPVESQSGGDDPAQHEMFFNVEGGPGTVRCWNRYLPPVDFTHPNAGIVANDLWIESTADAGANGFQTDAGCNINIWKDKGNFTGIVGVPGVFSAGPAMGNSDMVVEQMKNQYFAGTCSGAPLACTSTPLDVPAIVAQHDTVSPSIALVDANGPQSNIDINPMSSDVNVTPGAGLPTNSYATQVTGIQANTISPPPWTGTVEYAVHSTIPFSKHGNVTVTGVNGYAYDGIANSTASCSGNLTGSATIIDATHFYIAGTNYATACSGGPLTSYSSGGITYTGPMIVQPIGGLSNNAGSFLYTVGDSDMWNKSTYCTTNGNANTSANVDNAQVIHIGASPGGTSVTLGGTTWSTGVLGGFIACPPLNTPSNLISSQAVAGTSFGITISKVSVSPSAYGSNGEVELTFQNPGDATLLTNKSFVTVSTNTNANPDSVGIFPYIPIDNQHGVLGGSYWLSTVPHAPTLHVTWTDPAICTVGLSCVLGIIKGASFNSTSDQAITIDAFTVGDPHYIAAAKYMLTEIDVMNCSTALSTAAGGFYTATSKGGTIIGTTTTGYGNCTSATTRQRLTGLTDMDTQTRTESTLYLSLTTSQGTSATGDVYLIGTPLN